MLRRMHALLPHKIEAKFHFYFHGEAASDAIGYKTYKTIALKRRHARVYIDACVQQHFAHITRTKSITVTSRVVAREFRVCDRKNGLMVFYRRKIRRIPRIHSRYRMRKVNRKLARHTRHFPMMQITDLSRGIRRGRILESEVNRRMYTTPVNAMEWDTNWSRSHARVRSRAIRRRAKRKTQRLRFVGTYTISKLCRVCNSNRTTRVARKGYVISLISCKHIQFASSRMRPSCLV